MTNRIGPVIQVDARRIRVAAILAVAMLPLVASEAVAVERVFFERGPQERPSIWSASPSGGSRALIASYGESPALSPDGTRAVFLRRPTPASGTTNLHIHRFGGGSRLLASRLGRPVVWAPDSSAVAAHTPAGRLVVIDVATGRRSDLGPSSFFRPAFSPDSSHIAFTRTVGRAGIYRTSDLFIASVAGGRATRLTHGGRGQEPVWSAQGIIYAHVRARFPDANSVDIRRIDPAGGRSEIIVDVGSGEFGSTYPWDVSDDGTRLLGAASSVLSAPPVAVDVASGETRSRGTGYDYVADLSRDGTQILVTRRRADTLNGRVSIVPFGDGAPRVVAIGRSPSWNR